MTPKVKICGITSREDALAAAEAGADFLGYNFHPSSRRNVSPETAAAIVAAVREKYPQIQHVGVFVDANEQALGATHRTAGLDLLQLHGNETPELVNALKERGLRVLKAFRFGQSAPAPQCERFACEYYLCDTFDAASAGGTGRRFPLELIPPELPLDRTFVAGGLTPDNVAQVLQQIRPFAVDVASGVEEAPGRKSRSLVERFIRAVRQSGS